MAQPYRNCGHKCLKTEIQNMKTTGLLSILFFSAASLAFANDKIRTPRDQAVQATPQPVAITETKPHEPWIKVDVAITPREREIIQTHSAVFQVSESHHHGSGSLPPGLARK